jgi:hypothetical protein
MGTSSKLIPPSMMENPIHLMRWLRAQAAGGSEEAAAKVVAKEEGISLATARQSIRAVDAYRKKNDKSEFDYAIRNVVISTAPKVAETLAGLLTATELVEVKDSKTGKVRIEKVEDKTTRLEAARVWNSMMAAQIPKGPLIQQEISQNTQVAQLGAGETMEERTRRLREKAREYNALPPETTGQTFSEDDEEDGDGGDEEDE